jgi:hypothetical protein
MEETLPEDFIVICPNPQCKMHIIIEKLNCFIFRHGILKSNGLQIDPHASKELCDYYIQNNLIYGCGRPFQIIKNDKGEFVSVGCDYI